METGGEPESLSRILLPVPALTSTSGFHDVFQRQSDS